jgi:hypothetical protein
MALSVRLDEETESALETTAKLLGKSKSEVVKNSVKLYCDKVLGERSLSPYDRFQICPGRNNAFWTLVSAPASFPPKAAVAPWQYRKPFPGGGLPQVLIQADNVEPRR